MWFIHGSKIMHNMMGIMLNIFLAGSVGTGKSHLVKFIYSVISKIFLYHYKDLKKRESSFNCIYRYINSGTTTDITRLEPQFVLALQLNLKQMPLVVFLKFWFLERRYSPDFFWISSLSQLTFFMTISLKFLMLFRRYQEFLRQY